ncbi:MAG: transcriptional regulator [Chloroflexota bacterium]|nr:transcriptional regulator [Chloroflexota bacterium]
MDQTHAAADHLARVRQAVQAAHQRIPVACAPADIAAAVRAARTERGWTQEQLAAAAGVHRTPSIVDLEGGATRPHNPLTLVAVARALGRPWDWLGATAAARIAPGPGRALAVARIAQGLTISELAAASGLAVSTIHKLEGGTMAGTRRLWRDLAAALAVEPADLWPPYASK